MSMISAQCDELRMLASTLDTRYRYAEDIATALRDAADTIWQLRDDLQRANAENAKLVRVLHEVEREAVHAYKCLQKDCETMTVSASHYFEKWWYVECQNDRLKAKNAKLREERDTYRDLVDCMVHPDIPNQLAAENAKLRELCAEMYPYAKAFLKEGVMLGCIDSKSYDWFLQLHELGVEVDE